MYLLAIALAFLVVAATVVALAFREQRDEALDALRCSQKYILDLLKDSEEIAKLRDAVIVANDKAASLEAMRLQVLELCHRRRATEQT